MKRSLWIASFAVALLSLSAWAQDNQAAQPAAPAAPQAAPAAPGAPGAPAAPEPAPVKSPFANDAETLSYIIGANMGRSLGGQLKQDNLEISADVLTQGIKDGLAGGDLKMSQEDMQNFMMNFQQTMMQKRQQAATENAEKGRQFLEENAKKEGVKTTDTGVQYKVIQEGTGPMPKATDKVRVQYEGRLIDGTVFDSSAKHGGAAEFPVNGVIPGWTEALQLMKEGSKWQLYIPAAQAYGGRAVGDIPANSTLIFDVTLEKVLPQAEEQPTVNIPQQPKPAAPQQKPAAPKP